MEIKKLKGFRDIYGIDQLENNYIDYIISFISKTYGFNQISLPNLELTTLFDRSVGDNTDIVNKEMYTFVDKGDRSVTLKPEGTASATRVMLENKLIELSNQQKVFYIERMYRYERPQKGRYREFRQFGIE
jgi:histidyl-tRNA synthetase